jgi:lantibiotic modifying enzyme
MVQNRQLWLPAYRAQTVSLYDGTAGIALFLSWLVHFTEDSLERATLLGALNQLRQAVADARPADILGFYRGFAGIASAFMHAGNVLGEERWTRCGVEILTILAKIEPEATRLDVMDGSAGTIPSLLQAAVQFGREELILTAKAHGDLLLRIAVRSELGWSWNTDGSAENMPLVGYAHGASGIACALLELHGVTGEEQYREAALEGLRFERSQFNSQWHNGPDLRADGRAQGLPINHGARSAVTWCYGAPGVGFSRLQIREFLSSDHDVAVELETALQLTKLTLTQPAGMSEGFCLYNGAGGLADFLLEAAKTLGVPEWHQLADAVGRTGIATFHETDMPWPCGVLGHGETPNLMLGLAGIGYLYLRLHSPASVPCILVITPDAFAHASGARVSGRESRVLQIARPGSGSPQLLRR